MDHFCYLCFVFVVFSCLFIVALWCPAGQGLITWLSCVMFYCVIVTFPCGVLCQVGCLTMLIPDLCLLSHFDNI